MKHKWVLWIIIATLGFTAVGGGYLVTASNRVAAQAKAEERRAMAIALEQEMKAAVEENRAKVVLAEAEIPLAISAAFRAGHLGIMDYYNLRNLQSDTEMRNSLAGVGAARTDRPGEPR